MFVAASLIAAASVQAFSVDPQIMIDRALNSPTLTVRYTGVMASLVELRINGESLGTRTLDATRNTGETNFSVTLTDLKDGDNEVEIRLYDRTGKLVAKDKTNISTDQSNNGPVFLSAPKVGQTVQGPYDIKIGFGQKLSNVYVSFFVDGDFKSMSNFPPFSYLWDTTRETNGWHEVEAWAIDDSNTTLKTKKVRVFVNNPGGRTDRPGVASKEAATPSKNRTRIVEPTASDRDVRGATTKASSSTANREANDQVPTVSVGEPKSNKIRVAPASEAGLKPVEKANAVATGLRNMTPTGTRVVSQNVTVKTTRVATIQPTTQIAGSVLNQITAASTLLPITRGTRLPNLGAFAVVLDTQFVNFDVPTRVDGGVPMTPFRHLIEKAGGLVDWKNQTKTVHALADGKDITLKIGDKNAVLNNNKLSLELAPYIDRGRTIVPLSFIHDALNVNVDYDKETGHVLITSGKN